MWRELWNRLLFLIFRHRLSRELDEEMRTHQEMILENAARPARPFGHATRWKELSREAWLGPWLDAFAQDLRFAARQLVRNPGLAATVVMSLALGLGATTAMFSLTNALLYKRLPVPAAQQLVAVTHGPENNRGPSMSYPNFVELQRRSKKLADLFAVAGWQSRLRSGSLEQKILLGVVSGNFFSALRITPQTGRFFHSDNDRRGGPFRNAVILSHRLWRHGFQADPHILGRTVYLNRVPFAVIGVTRPEFFGVSPGTYVDAVITFAGTELLNPHSPILDCRQCNEAQVMGRMEPGFPLPNVQSALEIEWQNIKRESAAQQPAIKSRPSITADQLRLEPGAGGPDSYLRHTFTRPLSVLLGMSGLILLMACANVANLLLARATARQREMAVRLSTGASRSRIVQQFLTESLLFSLLGLAAGMAVYGLCVRGLLWFIAVNGTPVFLDTRPDPRIFLFALSVTLLATFFFGLGPTVRASLSPNLIGAMADHGPRASARGNTGRALLGVQLALSFVLLTGALLLARSLYELRTVDAGFRRDHLLIASPSGDESVVTPADQLRLAKRMLTRIERLPGIRSAGASTMLPVAGGLWISNYLPDDNLPRGKEDTQCFLNFVTPNFFVTIGTPLLAGRDFTARDQMPGAPATAIVSESFAQHFWGTGSPLGKHIREPGQPERLTIIGITRDARQRNLRQTFDRTVYRPFPPPSLSGILVRFQIEVWTATPPANQIAAMRNAFRQEKIATPVDLETFDVLIDRRLLYERLLAALAVSFGALGLVMAIVGVYGVAAYSASRRTFEVGVRIALGATRLQILRLFLQENLLLASVGLATGALAAFALTGFLKTWLFGVSAGDLPTYATVACLLLILATIATLLPASRTARTDPWISLRAE